MITASSYLEPIIENFEGIVTKSNYLSEITDLSPAFNFELFSKLLENE